ncbi:putative PAS/PAC sensor protein (plasmid) [Haloterrigena turkmenica DSM 5511]|uniref:PAS/PAC sensor protein n=1 Tax=Haloterrigena turkmenica (strain ATCC 51198 / DSM 5511 / JCM 9101 / NCIMB 13204 / VKM B-1734 / 4k) TaxID=543526 RepID=D2S3E8_HALTV|nr:bacterio-opsin activator domain-containing protein [Haloterrigena turkmenica]ADB63895.1 putative PAS/PAC sensor protein [Haloterrigena turkmenica DSM 5511]
MSDGTATVAGDVLRVLVVGDARRVDAATDALSSQLESISIVRERTLATALERLAQLAIHCVVCPFETGADPSPLAAVRDRDGEVPVVAVVDGAAADGRAAEAALEAGATDVVEADDPPSLVATRVRNLADRYRLETAPERRDGSVLERSDALVWVVDADGDLETVSSAVEPRLGYTPTELERTPLTRLVHPEDRESATDLLETAAATAFGTTERGTVRIGHADGTWRVYDLRCTNRLGDRDVDGLVCTLEPASVRESDGPARRALDRFDEAVFSLGPAWELRYANAAADRLFDADGSAEPGTIVWDLLDDAVRGRFAERFQEAAATEQVVTFETPYSSLESRLSVSVHPGANGVTVYAREADPAASPVDRERLDLLESVVDAVEDGLVVLEGSTIRFASAGLFESADAEPLVGRELDALFDDALAAAVRERASATVARWMEPLSGTLALDGRAVDVFVTPLSDDRVLCVVRDRRRSAAAALSTVGETVATIRAADSPGAVRRATVDAALTCAGADLAAWYLREDDRLRPAAVETASTAGSVDLPPIDPAETELLERLAEAETATEDEPGFETDTDAAGPAVAFDRSELESVLANAGIRAERVVAVPVGDRGVVLATSTEPMAFGERDRLPLETVVAAAATALEALEGAAAVRSCRTDLERLEYVVDRCRRLREIERTLLAGETRREIESSLCEALVSLSLDEEPGAIDLAWIGDVSAGSDHITPDAWAGRNGDAIESMSVPMDGDDESTHPTARAATALEPTAAVDIDADDHADETTGAWDRRTAEREFRSALSVPLAIDDFCYGTLTVYAEQPVAFDDATRAVCTHLAAVASHAIAAVERKRALLSERVTELEIVLQGADEPLSAVAHRLERRLDVEAVVPRSSAGSTVFCTATDVTEDALRAAVEPVSGVESGRLVGERPDASLLELVLTTSTLATTLAEHGGVLRSVVPVDDRTRLVVDLSSTVDVRSFVGLIERRQPGANLVARRERDRSVQPARAFDTELRARLSERQLRTLETAYYGGFFEWPRESTGEEIADSLGVSQPTFSRHLRLAQRKVFALLFDERPDAAEE